jgi:hypothetical protein
LSGQSAWAFALGGPINEPFQVAALNYVVPGDITAPKNIGEEYRRNTPVMYYAFDANFLGFFGTDGMRAVGSAFDVFNSVTNVSSYSSDLSEFPLEAERVNETAFAMQLLDLKSVTMGLLTEQLGLDEPVRWVWCLHDRIHLAGNVPPCPAAMAYSVIKRNFDVTTSDVNHFQYSSFVNGTLYSYEIVELCSGTPWLADAVEFSVDPLARKYTAVADYFSDWYDGLVVGDYYTGLTRDDVAGMRYLMRTNNYNIESTGPGTFEFDTNSQPAAITTFDLNLFAAQAATNNAAALIALYPGLIINTTSNVFGLQITTNITEILVNGPFDPAGFLPSHGLFTTNYTTNFFTFFQHTFANLVTNTFSTRGIVGEITLGLTNAPFAPAGLLPTVTTNVRPVVVNGVFGDFFILPTNLCGAQILSNFFTTVIPTVTPPVGATSTVGVTNLAVTFTPGTVTFFTNHEVIYLPVSCPADTVADRQGIEHVQFIRRDFDSLLNQTWEPITNDYTMMALTNNTLVPQHIRRVVTAPDFLFTAADLAIGPGAPGPGAAVFLRNVNFNQGNILPQLAGPGTIEPPTQITFDKVGPIFLVTGLATGVFLQELTQTPILLWGSFDGSTNLPVVYPNGTSIQQVENLLLMSVTTTSLPDGTVGADYSTQLAGTGAQPPYTWSIAAGGPGLPPGLSLTPDGLISGTPTASTGGTIVIGAVTYDFTVTMTDANGRSVDQPLSITIQPQ